MRLTDLLPDATFALIVGSGGPAFFDRFQAGPEACDGASDPLDRYTRRIVGELVARALAPLAVGYAIGFPFGAEPFLPFQRLGRAAGLGGPGPLGLQIHPIYGPWWAYRAVVAVNRSLSPEPPPGDGCAGCAAPCVVACPASAVQRGGFSIVLCQAHRRVAEPCRLSCAARIACIRGPEHRYADRELAFHMAAALPKADTRADPKTDTSTDTST